MLEQFTEYIQKEHLCRPGEAILLSVSGGPDSVLLAFLFRMAGYSFGMAHCNYQLRGDESDADEAFVAHLAGQWNVPFYLLRVPTRQMAHEQGRSIQEVARDARYEWLEHVRREHAYDHIATAHHLNDAIETQLFNLANGCGIRGLHGILPKRGRLIRPLLFARKEQILALLDQEGLAFREDRSNQELYYDRNKIRHRIVPVLRELNPNFEEGARKTLQRLRESEAFFEEGIRMWKEKVVHVKGSGLRIDRALLQNSPAPATLLYEILAPYGFHPAQLQGLSGTEAPQAGKQWFSKSHRLLSDRGFLLLEPLPSPERETYMLQETDAGIVLPDGELSMQLLNAPPSALPASEWEAVLDARMVRFPLHLRRWRAGDTFHPLGMGGRSKKLQDFFSDLKLSVFEKEKVWILDSNGQIAWIVGHRIDELFKLQPDTTSCWHFRFKKARPATAG